MLKDLVKVSVRTGRSKLLPISRSLPSAPLAWPASKPPLHCLYLQQHTAQLLLVPLPSSFLHHHILTRVPISSNPYSRQWSVLRKHYWPTHYPAILKALKQKKLHSLHIILLCPQDRKQRSMALETLGARKTTLVFSPSSTSSTSSTSTYIGLVQCQLFVPTLLPAQIGWKMMKCLIVSI